MNFKLSLICFSCVSSAIYAAELTQNPSTTTNPRYFDGFYGGIGAGISHTTSEYYYTQTMTTYSGSTLNVGYTLDVTDVDLGKTTLAGETLAGFGKEFTGDIIPLSYYLGIELFGRYNPLNINYNGSTIMYNTSNVLSYQEIYTLQLQNKFSFGGAIKLGWLPTPKILAYILLGVDLANFLLNGQTTGAGLANGSFQTVPVNYLNYSQNKWAFMPGIGFETMVTDKIGLNFKYTYSFYGDFSYSKTFSFQDLTTANQTNNLYHTYDFQKISRGLLTASLIYHFNGI